jgi:hypothetical protein
MKPLTVFLLIVLCACSAEKLSQPPQPDYFIADEKVNTHYFRINPAVPGDDNYYFNLRNNQLPVLFPAAGYPSWEDFYKAVVSRESLLTPAAVQFCYEALFREYRFFELPATVATKAAAEHGMRQLTQRAYLGYSVMYNILLWMKRNGLATEAAALKKEIMYYGVVIPFPRPANQSAGATGTADAIDRVMALQRTNMEYLEKIRNFE